MLLLALLACKGGPDLPGSPADDDPATDPGLPTALVCTGATLPVLQPAGFDNLESELKVWQDPAHYAQDVLTSDDDTLVLYGRFTYGLLEDPLRDEAVEVFVDTCGAEPLKLGTFRTNDDGRIQVDLGSDVIPTYGEHQLVMRVLGDGSRASATLRRFPVGTHLQVFDIDGTLTTSDTELFLDLFSEIGDGSYIPVPREDAEALTRLRSDQGYEVVYLTGRPTSLRRLTADWLVDLGFAPGTLFLTRRPEQLLPFDDGVGRFKADHVQALRAAGFVVDFAYGNATTDIFAYAQAGVAPQQTMIMGDHGGEAGTVDGGEGYTQHLTDVGSEAPVQQPFTW